MPILGSIGNGSASLFGIGRSFGRKLTPTAVVDYLIIAGGGAGGPNSGGGGGAGGYLAGSGLAVVFGQSYTISVGSGGTGVSGTRVLGTSGSNSGIFRTSTGGSATWATGGGYGSYSGDQNDSPARNGVAAGSGGSGGGAGGQFNSTIGQPSKGTGTPGQGFDGGSISVANPMGSQAGGAGGGG